jgi:hypothetical protein
VSKRKPQNVTGADKPAAKRKPAPAVIVNDGNGTAAASGRPSKYLPEYAGIARKMCELGAIDADIADALGVSTSSISNWAATYPEFCDALQVGKGEFDARIVRSLAQRAAGYSFDSCKIFMPAGAAAPVYAPYREHVPPDVNAAKLWLTNRRRDEWADTSKHELTGRDGAALIPESVSSRDLARSVLQLLREARIDDGAGASADDDPDTELDGATQRAQPSMGAAAGCSSVAPAAASPEHPRKRRVYNPSTGRLDK